MGAGADIGVKAMELRTRRGWSRIELVRRSGVPLTELFKLEHGLRYRVEAETLKRLALGLEVSADYLLGLTDEPTPAGRRAGAPVPMGD